jgi:CRISPR system Cascade subunit CasE
MGFPSAPLKQTDPDFLRPFDPLGFAPVHAPRTADQAFLYRVDHTPDADRGYRPVILVQSAQRPDWDYAFHNALHLLAAPPGEPRAFNPSFSPGQRFCFRLRANPAKRACTGKCAGERVPVGHDSGVLCDWVRRKAAGGGFVMQSCEVRETGWALARHPRSGSMTFFSVLFEGLLEVADPALFTRTIASGIGPAKAFGFGLLSIAPVAEA